LSEPAAGRCARRADAAGREPDHRLAADRGPGRGNYPAVRGGLRYLSASGSSRVDHDPEKWKQFSGEDDAQTKLDFLSDLISSDQSLAITFQAYAGDRPPAVSFIFI